MRGVSSDSLYLREVERALINAPFGGDWRDALAMIAIAAHSQGVDLVSLGGPLPSLNIITGYDQGAIDDAFCRPELWGEANWRVGCTRTPFKISYDADYAAYREQHDTRIYDEVAHDTGMPFGCQTIFAQDETGFLGLALMRTERQGRCTAETLSLFDRLCRVTARSIKAEAALAGQGAAVALGELDSLDRAVVLLNRHGWRCAASPLADAILVAGFPLQSSRERIRLSHRGDDYRFQQLLAFLLSAPPSAMMNASIHTQGWRIQLTHLPNPVGQLAFGASLALTIVPLDEHNRIDE